MSGVMPSSPVGGSGAVVHLGSLGPGIQSPASPLALRPPATQLPANTAVKSVCPAAKEPLHGKASPAPGHHNRERRRRVLRERGLWVHTGRSEALRVCPEHREDGRKRPRSGKWAEQWDRRGHLPLVPCTSQE